jgi:hypothetical protein
VAHAKRDGEDDAAAREDDCGCPPSGLTHFPVPDKSTYSSVRRVKASVLR